jgi:GntR family transcriptional regulator/MocR family aminotransferase
VRESIARHVGASRAVKTTADDIILTQGAQQAVDLVARVLIEPGTCVGVEDPCYPFVPPLLRSYGARVVGVPVDEHGLDVAKLPATAKVVYVTPSHQCPLGMAMSLARRTALLDWAERRNALIVEDDYDTEFRFGGRPLDPLQSLDSKGRVLYVGTFSKVMLPVLRLGFMVVPASLRQAFRSAKLLADGMGVVPMQQALARFIDEGLLVRHIRKASKEYAARYARLVTCVDDTMQDWLEVLPAVAGLHLSVLIRKGRSVSDVRVAERARASGLLLLPISPMYVGPVTRQGFALGYGGLPISRIAESVRRLRVCLEAEAGTGRNRH